MSDSLRPHGLQPTRLLCPWDFPGKRVLEWVAIAFSVFPPNISQFVLCIPAKQTCSLLCTNFAFSYFTLCSSSYWNCIMYSFQVWLTATTSRKSILTNYQRSLSRLMYSIGIFGHFSTNSYSYLKNPVAHSMTLQHHRENKGKKHALQEHIWWQNFLSLNILLAGTSPAV